MTTKTPQFTLAQLPKKLIDDMKKFKGLPPYQGLNPCCGDGYFGAAIVEEFGVEKAEAAQQLVK